MAGVSGGEAGDAAEDDYDGKEEGEGEEDIWLHNEEGEVSRQRLLEEGEKEDGEEDTTHEEKGGHHEGEAEEEKAGLLQKLMFSWATELVKLAKRFEGEADRQKEEESAKLKKALGVSHDASAPALRLERELESMIDEEATMGSKNDDASRDTNKKYSRLEEEHLFSMPNEEQLNHSKKSLKKAWAEQLKKSSPSLFRAMYSAFGGWFLYGTINKIIADATNFVTPVLLNRLLDYLALDPQPDPFDHVYVFSLIFGMILCQIVMCISNHHWYHHAYRLGIRVRGAVSALIFEKSLKLSNSSRQQKTVGEITNLMSIDSSMIAEELTPYLNYLWSCPIQVALCLFFLFQLLGWAAFAGIAMLIFLTIPAALISKKTKSLQASSMGVKDERTKSVNETLQAIRIIKVQAWEGPSFERVKEHRDKELQLMKKIRYLTSINGMFWTLSPMLVSLTTFATYGIVMKQELQASTVFTALVYFNILRAPIGILPGVINSLITGRVSLTRIQDFLLSEEVQESDFANYKENEEKEIVASISNGEFSWVTSSDKAESKNSGPTLSDINLEIEKGELVMIIGPVGSGKSSLLAALLGEITRTKGTIQTYGKKGYCAQQAWIQNAKLIDNVLFGRKYDPVFFNQVLDAVCLKQDLELLPGGELVEIGEKGINLSGGQKQRVSLARCCYADTDIVILDDPLSALDPHVGKSVFENCILGLLKGKTRIVVTHALQYLPYATKIVVMESGRIRFCGDYSSLMASSLTEIIDCGSHSSTNKNEDDDSTIDPVTTKEKTKQSSGAGGLIVAEERDIGSVKFLVVRRYLESIGNPWTVSFILVILFSGYRGFQTANDFILSLWAAADTSEVGSASFSTSHTEISELTRTALYYLVIMLGVSSVSVILFLVLSIVLVYLGNKASERIHEELLRAVMRSPVRFFDVTPIGRILNRFTKDMYSLDASIPMTSGMLGVQIFTLLSAFITIAITTPIIIIPLLPLFWICVYIQQLFRPVARDVKRLDAILKSPVNAFFSETISGIPTVRAFNKEKDFKNRNADLLTRSLSAYYTSMSCNRWLGIRLDMLGVTVIGFSSALSVIFATPENVGSIGLAISYALSVTSLINWMVRSFIDIETSFIAVERLFDYIDLPSEAPNIIEDSRPPHNWPNEGKIVFNDVKIRYRQELDYALKGVSFTINPGEKIGIVGRTGAGKSTILQALFRIVEATEGSIEIDGIDISEIGLFDLRKSLAIIPQDPVLFQGTVRYNLDPFDEYSDDAIWDTLRTIPPLYDLISSLPGRLSASVTENGDNLSVGEKQLLCLSRALLKKTKILVLDEATASVDFQTDNIIQNSLRNLKDTTFLCIAHRLNTIMDCDKILVMDSGLVAEFGTVPQLLSNPSSKFYQMAKQSGLV